MIIYKITNLVNGKSYVGQSTCPFERRYTGGKWWKYTSSSHLKYSAKKYGVENFSVEFLEVNVSSIEKLNELECFYIQKYNSLHPNGYNSTTGGKNCKKSRESILRSAVSKRRLKEIKIKNNETDEVFEFETIADAARFIGCLESNTLNMLYGVVSSVGIWTLPENFKKYWIVTHINGAQEKIIEGTGHIFAKKHGFSPDEMGRLLSGLEQRDWIATLLFPGKGVKTRPIRKTALVHKMIRGENFHKERVWLYDPKQNLCLKIRREPGMVEKITPFFQGYQKYQIQSIFFKEKRVPVNHIQLFCEEPLIEGLKVIDLTTA